MILPKLTPAREYEIIAAIINAVGRPITLSYVLTRGPCTVCGGTDPFCSTCHGNPTVDTLDTKTVTANIVWKGSDQKLYKPQGQAVEGDCLINFMVDTVESVDTLDELLKKVISVTVDNRVCVIDRWYYRGSPINRVYLVLNQDSNTGEQRIG